MKKSLIALAVAGALTAPMVAQADATLYGSFRIGIQNVDDKALDIVDESSRIGIKGDVDLGLEGTKGLFHWEANINTSDSDTYGQMFGKRLGYIGMTGDWGTALIGRQYHPHYLWVNGPTNIFNTATSKTGEWAQLGNDYHKRTDNTLAYASPVMGGFQVIGGLVIGASTDDASDDVDGYNVAARYAANGLTVAASIGEVDNKTLGAAEDNETWGVSASYVIDALTVAARYEDKENFEYTSVGTKTTVFVDEADVWELSAVYNLGNGLNLKARYSEVDATVAGVSGDADQWGVEVEQILGKGRVYANYFAFDNDAEDILEMADTLTVGYRVDF